MNKSGGRCAVGRRRWLLGVGAWVLPLCIQKSSATGPAKQACAPLQYSLVLQFKWDHDHQMARERLDKMAERHARRAGKTIVKREYFYLPFDQRRLDYVDPLAVYSYSGIKWWM